MQTKITKRTVDSLSAASDDRLLWDAEVKGFGVRCRPSGAKHYVLKMRVGGRQRWITIGRHGAPPGRQTPHDAKPYGCWGYVQRGAIRRRSGIGSGLR